MLGSSGLYRDGDWSMFWCLSEGVRRCLCNSQFIKNVIYDICVARKGIFLVEMTVDVFFWGACLQISKQRRSQNEDIHVLDNIFLMFVFF